MISLDGLSLYKVESKWRLSGSIIDRKVERKLQTVCV